MSSSTSTLPFQTFSLPASHCPPPANSTSFSLTPPFSTATDIWRKPSNPISGAEVRTFNAPIVYKKVKIGKFKRCRVSVKAEWKRLYDQGGLVFVLPPASSTETEEVDEKGLKWIKAGIEFYKGQPFIGHVACHTWADWSLTQAGITEDGNVTIEMERDAKEGTLWLFSVAEKGERFPIREVTWALADEELSPEREIWVGAYAATPIVGERKGESDALSVRFKGWELELEE